MKREQSLHKLQIEQYVGDIEGPPIRKKYRDSAKYVYVLYFLRLLRL